MTKGEESEAMPGKAPKCAGLARAPSFMYAAGGGAGRGGGACSLSVTAVETEALRRNVLR